MTQIEGRVIKINKAVDCPGEARQDWRSSRTSPRRSAATHGLHLQNPARDLRGAARRVQGRRRRLLRHHLREDRGATSASSGPARATIPTASRSTIPGTPRLFEPGSLEPGREGRRAVLFPGRQGPLQRRRLRAAGRGRGRRVSDHPHDRPRGQPVPLRHADAPHRPAGRSVPGAADRDAPAAGGASSASPTATGRRPRRRAATVTLARAGGDDDPAGHGLHSVPLGRAARASTS